MAGIGFALKRLAGRDNLGGVAGAFVHGTIASSGPWLLTVLCLAAVTLLAVPVGGREAVSEFRVMVMYNFAFSLVFTGGIVRLVTRLLADQLYARDASDAPGVMVGAVLVSALFQLPIVAGVYLFVLDVAPLAALLAVVNYFLVSTIWVLAVFLSALKVYGLITLIFGGGLAGGLGAAMWGVDIAGLSGMLLGFNLGLAMIVTVFGARILAEYPGRVTNLFGFVAAIHRYWTVFAAGVVYNLAIWVDKWIMWFAPERENLPNGMIYYSNYDSAMFLAFVTTVPALTIFLVGIETRFFRNYLGFYKGIEGQATLAGIRARHRRMIEDLGASFRNVFVLQGLISLLCILLAPRILTLFETDFIILGIFRLGVLGAFFHTMLLLVTIILSYFDLRREVLGIYLLFLVLNGALTWWSMSMGFGSYGLGYCAAAIVTFLVAALVLIREIERISYLTFMRNPASS